MPRKMSIQSSMTKLEKFNCKWVLCSYLQLHPLLFIKDPSLPDASKPLENGKLASALMSLTCSRFFPHPLSFSPSISFRPSWIGSHCVVGSIARPPSYLTSKSTLTITGDDYELFHPISHTMKTLNPPSIDRGWIAPAFLPIGAKGCPVDP